MMKAIVGRQEIERAGDFFRQPWVNAGGKESTTEKKEGRRLEEQKH